MNATEIPSGSQHNFYFPSSTLLNILGMVVRRCRHLLRFRSWFVDHPAASRQVSHPSCRHHRIHRHIHLCPYLHPCHPCLDRKQTVGRILFCWNSPLLNAKNQDRSSQIEQKVNNDFQLSRGATQCNTMQLVYFKFTTFKAILRANSRPPAESRRLGSDQANHDVFKLMARPLPANSTFKLDHTLARKNDSPTWCGVIVVVWCYCGGVVLLWWCGVTVVVWCYCGSVFVVV